MIFPEIRTVFLHVARCAGTSIEQWLAPGHRDPFVADRKQLFGWDPREGCFLQHATAEAVRRLVGAEVFDQSYKCSVVRNPYTRMASVYHYQRAMHEELYGDFSNFVRRLPELAKAPEWINGSHYLPQVKYTKIDGADICDHVARFEFLPESVSPIAESLGLLRPLPHENASIRPVWGNDLSGLYNSESCSIIRDLYGEDFDAFDYSTDLDKAIEESRGASAGFESLADWNSAATESVTESHGEYFTIDFVTEETTQALCEFSHQLRPLSGEADVSVSFLSERLVKQLVGEIRQIVPRAINRMSSELPIEAKVSLTGNVLTHRANLTMRPCQKSENLKWLLLDRPCALTRIDECENTFLCQVESNGASQQQQSQSMIRPFQLLLFPSETCVEVELLDATTPPFLCVTGELSN